VHDSELLEKPMTVPRLTVSPRTRRFLVTLAAVVGVALLLRLIV